MALGLVLYFFLADGPSTAKWIKKEDRPLAVARVAQSGVGLKTPTSTGSRVSLPSPTPRSELARMAGKSVTCADAPQLASVAGHVRLIGSNGVLTNFSGSIIKGLGWSTFEAALLDCAGRSLQVISLMVAGFVATRWANTRLLMMTIGNLLCVFGTA